MFIPFLEESKESVADEEEDDSDDDVEPIAEFRFVPNDKSACEYCIELILFPLCTKHCSCRHTHTPLPSLPAFYCLFFVLASVILRTRYLLISKMVTVVGV